MELVCQGLVAGSQVTRDRKLQINRVAGAMAEEEGLRGFRA